METDGLLKAVQDCQVEQEKHGQVGVQAGTQLASAVLAFTEVMMKTFFDYVSFIKFICKCLAV